MDLALDSSVCLVLDELQKHALTNNTLVFFVNDNGGVSGHDNTPLRGFRGSTWEGGIRIPCASQWPAGLPQGDVLDAPVIALDIFPTAMAAAGIRRLPGQPLDGVNLLPFILGETKERPHQTLYWKNGNKWAVRDGDLKAVFGNSEGPGKKGKPATEIALFDLLRDIKEANDLASSRAEDVARLEKLYLDWKKDFPIPTWGGGREK